MENILSYEQVRDGVRDVINAHPEGVDHVYSRPEGAEYCLYVHDNEPSCIVGHYLINTLGVAKHVIQNHEGIGASTVVGILHTRGLMPDVDYWAATFLGVVQREQDSGATWGEAYEYASDHVEGRRRVYNEALDKQ
jgi:hypothetical protein